MSSDKNLESYFVEKFVGPLCDALREKYNPYFQESPESLIQMYCNKTGTEFVIPVQAPTLTQADIEKGCQEIIKCGNNKGTPCGKNVKGLNSKMLPVCGRHITDTSKRNVGSTAGRANFVIPQQSFQGFPEVPFTPLTTSDYIPQAEFNMAHLEKSIPVNIGSIPVNDGNRLQIHTVEIEGSNEVYDRATNIIYKYVSNEPLAYARYDENYNVLPLREKEWSMCNATGVKYSNSEPLQLTPKVVEEFGVPQLRSSRAAASSFNPQKSSFNNFVPPPMQRTSATRTSARGSNGRSRTSPGQTTFGSFAQ